jgi:hypothetical protein
VTLIRLFQQRLLFMLVTSAVAESFTSTRQLMLPFYASHTLAMTAATEYCAESIPFFCAGHQVSNGS